jgi:hypothetical protein
MLSGASAHSCILLLVSILTSCRPSRALALPPRVSALYSKDFSKAVRRLRRSHQIASHLHSSVPQAKPKLASQRKDREHDASKATSIWNLAGWYARATLSRSLSFPVINFLQVRGPRTGRKHAIGDIGRRRCRRSSARRRCAPLGDACTIRRSYA